MSTVVQRCVHVLAVCTARHGAYSEIALLPAGCLSIDDQIPDVSPDIRRWLLCGAGDHRCHHIALLSQDVPEKGVELGCCFDQEQVGPLGRPAGAPGRRPAGRVRGWRPFIAVGRLDRHIARLGESSGKEGVEVGLRRDDEQTGYRSLSAKPWCCGSPLLILPWDGRPHARGRGRHG